jgi:hypothetical protein
MNRTDSSTTRTNAARTRERPASEDDERRTGTAPPQDRTKATPPRADEPESLRDRKGELNDEDAPLEDENPDRHSA